MRVIRERDEPGEADRLFAGRFRIGPTSNRMGYRLTGAHVPAGPPADGLSGATPVGTIQVPPSGEPILLMADRQTTGGYPAPATVISADVGLVAQLAPGDWVEFQPCERGAALAALAARERAMPSTSGRSEGGG